MIVIGTSHVPIVRQPQELVANALIDSVENEKYGERRKKIESTFGVVKALNKYLGERRSECLRLHPAYTEFIDTVSPLNGTLAE
jgi:hypothetical protein